MVVRFGLARELNQRGTANPAQKPTGSSSPRRDLRNASQTSRREAWRHGTREVELAAREATRRRHELAAWRHEVMCWRCGTSSTATATATASHSSSAVSAAFSPLELVWRLLQTFG
ncbi:unnamed protein product [Urochloa humidicola]